MLALELTTIDSVYSAWRRNSCESLTIGGSGADNFVYDLHLKKITINF